MTLTGSNLLHLDTEDGRRLATVVFPERWLSGAGWLSAEGIGSVALPDGDRAWFAGGVLNDGTNLLGLVYPGGQRALRAPLAGGMEEVFDGRDLDQEQDAVLIEGWRAAVEAWVRSGRELRDAVGGSR